MKRCVQLLLAAVFVCPAAATPGQGSYTITDLGTFGGTRSEARVINNRGWVLCVADGVGYVLYQELGAGAVSSVLRPHPNATITLFNNMNNYGILAGRVSFPPPRGGIQAFFGQTPPYKLFRGETEAADINDLGVGAGFVVTNFYIGATPVFKKRAARFFGSEVRALGTLDTELLAESHAFAINDRGTIVGRGSLGSTGVRAFRWLGGGALQNIHSTTVRTNSVALAVNNNGQITGFMFNFPTVIDSQAFLWDETNGMTALPYLPGDSRATPLGMNNLGEVVGGGFASGTAILWKTNKAIILQDLLPAGHGWDLDGAYSINDFGQIVGYGKRGGVTHAFLMSPTNVIPPVRVSWELIDPQPLLQGADVTGNKTRLSEAGGIVAGLAADGASRLVIRLESAASGTFTLSLDPQEGALTSGNISEDGFLSPPGVASGQSTMALHTTDVGGKQQAFLVYHAPEYFDRSTGEDSSATRRTILAALRFKPDDALEQNLGVPIVIARPPVIVMHGIWSNRKGAFGHWEEEMRNLFPGLIIDGPDYDNSASFAQNDSVFWTAIHQVRGAYRQQGIVATRADVFAHSMGGILSRIWTLDSQYERPENFRKGDINRLVTIDSPHLGAFVADINWSLRRADSFTHTVVSTFAEAFKKSLVGGAANDLSTFSDAMREMHSKRVVVPSHAIVGETNYDFTINPFDNPIPGSRYIAKAITWATGFKGVTVSIPTYSDYVVTVDSQAGALLPPESSKFQHEHSGAANQAHVIEHSRALLLSRPSSTFFAPGFPGVALPTPPCLFDAAKMSVGKSAVPKTTGTIAITSLSEGASVAAGSLRTVVVEPVDGFEPVSVLMATTDLLLELTNAPYYFPVRFATNYIGPQTITVAAADAASNIVTTTVHVNVFTSAGVNALRVEPGFLQFALPESRQRLAVFADYSDGITRDVTSGNAGTTYVSSDTNVITVNTNGEVTAHASGFALVTASKSGQQAVAEVNVELMGSANLVLSQGMGAAQPFTGQPVALSISITNLGPQTASNVVLAAELPLGAEFISSNLGDGACVVIGGTVVCTLDVLTNGWVATISLVVRFAQAGTNQISFAASFAGFDFARSDNASQLEITLLPAPVLGLRKTASTLVLSVENPGDGFILEQSTNLNPPVMWSLVQPLPATMTNRIELEMELPSAPTFYRLRKP